MVRKKSSSEVSQFTFDKHDYAARVDTARTHQPAFAAEHAFVHLLVGTLILAAADERVNLAEIELREISGRADRRAGPASDAGLQMVYPKLIAAIRYAPRYRAAASAAAVASFNDSPIFFGAVTVPA